MPLPNAWNAMHEGEHRHAERRAGWEVGEETQDRAWIAAREARRVEHEAFRAAHSD